MEIKMTPDPKHDPANWDNERKEDQDRAIEIFSDETKSDEERDTARDEYLEKYYSDD